MLLQVTKWYWSIGQLFLYVDKLNLLPRNQMREWYNGSIVAFQAIDPGSTPGSRTFCANLSCKTILVNWSAVSLYWQAFSVSFGICYVILPSIYSLNAVHDYIFQRGQKSIIIALLLLMNSTTKLIQSYAIGEKEISCNQRLSISRYREAMNAACIQCCFHGSPQRFLYREALLGMGKYQYLTNC